MTHLFQNPRSGWKHKVSHPSRAARLGTPPWGGAKRNPRLTKRKQTERAQPATAPALRFTVMKGYRPLGGLCLHTPTNPWGCASLHLRLDAVAALRGLKTKLRQLIQSFLKFVGHAADEQRRKRHSTTWRHPGRALTRNAEGR